MEAYCPKCLNDRLEIGCEDECGCYYEHRTGRTVEYMSMYCPTCKEYMEYSVTHDPINRIDTAEMYFMGEEFFMGMRKHDDILAELEAARHPSRAPAVEVE